VCKGRFGISWSNGSAPRGCLCGCVQHRQGTGQQPRGDLEKLREGTGAQAGPGLPAHPRGNRGHDAGAAVAAPPLPGPQGGSAAVVPPLPSPAGATRCCAAGRLRAQWTTAGTAGGVPPPRGSSARRRCLPGSWLRPAGGKRCFRVRAAAAGAAAAGTAGARTPTWVSAARAVPTWEGVPEGGVSLGRPTASPSGPGGSPHAATTSPWTDVLAHLA
jgi:hypothetical protein